MSHVLLWQPSECVYLIVNCVISFSENKYDDDDLNVCPLVPLIFVSVSNNSSILSLVNPLYILNTSIKSCL